MLQIRFKKFTFEFKTDVIVKSVKKMNYWQLIQKLQHPNRVHFFW